MSLQDRICLLVANELQATLYSNDKPLITAASVAGVRAEWGLELLLELVITGEITCAGASEVAERICNRSIYYSKVLGLFKSKLQQMFPGA